jgi:hypothetical protein
MIHFDLLGLAFTGMLGLLVFVAWMGLLLPARLSTAEWLLAAFLCTTCHILAMQIALGLAHVLTSATLGLMTAISMPAICMLAIKRAKRTDAQRRLVDAQVAFKEIAASRAATVLLVMLAALHVWVIFLAGIFPPYAYDEFYYHMPIVAQIIQERTILPASSSIVWINAYPRFSEMLSVWTSIFLHRDTWADLAMLPFWSFGGLAMYAIARKFGATRAWGVLCAALWWFCPAVFIQAKSTYNDVMVAALWAMALCFILPARKKDEPHDRRLPLLMTALAAGLLPATKISGLLFAAALFALLFFALLLQRASRRIAMASLATFAAIAMCAGGIWFVVNTLGHVNLVYPVPVKVLGRTLLQGEDFAVNAIIDGEAKIAGGIAPALRHASAWFDAGNSFVIGERFSGFGPLWAGVGLPALLVGIVVAAWRRHWMLVGMVGVSVLLLAAIPASWTPRYGLFLIAVSAGGLALLEPWLRPRARGIAKLLVVGLSAISIALAVDMGSFDAKRIRTFAQLPESERIATRWDAGAFGATHQQLARLTQEKSVTVAYAGFMLPYPLWGEDFRNRVIHVPLLNDAEYFDVLKVTGVNYFFAPANSGEANALTNDPRARRIDEGNDSFVLYEIQP